MKSKENMLLLKQNMIHWLIAALASSLDDYIRTHFNSKTKVQAIKYYREQTGLGLKEAKMAFENIL